ncbi:hypothetical protein [Nitrococcus mobilis]|uniref:hypothetical protein n=1 Tax=Nitrococcus mobilis TaxID=35797 RepID=UPI0012EA0E7E|nr:hypothetical protein [Nitrococcus mobilis]
MTEAVGSAGGWWGKGDGRDGALDHGSFATGLDSNIRVRLMSRRALPVPATRYSHLVECDGLGLHLRSAASLDPMFELAAQLQTRCLMFSSTTLPENLSGRVACKLKHISLKIL